ncbi:COG4 transport protein-domain-containing protein [Fimicolochytrium jonesii]|uniref:COG4 transport protein-domain-containing protein n=1 Tax=Fimicolochytrium jonesii TaxID=1396493 RepID=UPI0022FEB0D3|nr:COG4 transport protein-domain-containing protein [Fimicolochytrium jonesii]KAI8821159.1 COG4 transport protein-domain-containing protein [Fimicolochytrium jonesii]
MTVDTLSLDAIKRLTDISTITAQLRAVLEAESGSDARLAELMETQGDVDVERKLRELDALRCVRGASECGQSQGFGAHYWEDLEGRVEAPPKSLMGFSAGAWPPQIEFVRHDAQPLLKVLGETSTLAERISGKVRQLDLEQGRVKATIGLVDDIQELQKCAVGVDKALAALDYERAGDFVSRYLSYDPSVVERIFAAYATSDQDAYFPTIKDAADPTPKAASYLETLKKAQQQLTDVAMDEFDNAVQAANEEAILRYFKIFPLVGHHEVGLDKFSAYICGSISRQCQDNMRESADQPLFYAKLLTQLFETIAMIVDRQEAMVNSVYGPGKMLRVIQRLQREADIQGSIILNAFSERRQLQRKLADVAKYEASLRKKPSATAPQVSLDTLVEPRDVDTVLNELALISQKARIFDRFLHVRAEGEALKVRETPVTTSTDWTSSLDGEGDGLVKVSKLDELSQQLMSDYVSLEEYFIRRSVEKAMSIDTLDNPNDLTSSSVEDVFYILKTCARRALTTSDSNCISAIVNGIGRILELDYINIFQSRLSAAFSMGVAEAGGVKEGAGKSGGYMVVLNNIDVSCEYIVKLTEELDDEVGRLFAPSQDLSVEKIRSCLGVLSEYADSFRSILKTWIDNIFKQQMKPRIRPLLQSSYLQDVKYNITTSDEYAQQEVNDAFIKRFIPGWTKLCTPYKRGFSEWNLDHTMGCMVDFMAREWERFVIQMFRFTQLGALRFDRDVRTVAAHFTATLNTHHNVDTGTTSASSSPGRSGNAGGARWSTREKFARLSQMSTLLNLDSVEEVLELWGKPGAAGGGGGVGGGGAAQSGGGSITWRLSAKDVKKILALRVDFNPDTIAKLEL